MKSKKNLIKICFIAFLFSQSAKILLAQPDKVVQQNTNLDTQINICGKGWKAWLDSTASWQNDSLFIPYNIDVSKISAKQPSCGWDNFYKSKGILAKIPASFEEIFGKGDPLWCYHGVGWFYKEIDIPANWQNKTIRIEIEKARLRLEIYVNEKLAGYDMVAETPYKVDISKYIVSGQKNRIAFRITNPGGQRGWFDAPVIEWGDYRLIPGHDFGGIGGNVILSATDGCFIEDLFVKNLLPAKGKRIEIQSFIENKINENQFITIDFEIISVANNLNLYSFSKDTIVKANAITKITHITNVPDAKLWDTDNPNLYYCNVKIKGNGFSDTYTQRFGFRTFEVKSNDAGEQNFYLNGKRIRIRSAIDWGYYAQSGFYPFEEQARKSVANAKAIGLNCLSFHRRIGEPLVMKYADELGLLIYEEPGGCPGIDMAYVLKSKRNIKSTFYKATFPEKFRRMMLRDKNHPSVIIYNISNEQDEWDWMHKQIFSDAVLFDNSRLLINQSGGDQGGGSGLIPHLKPYHTIPELNYIDDHTVQSQSRFQEKDFRSHKTDNDSCIVYWGEVRCYCGPPNYYLLADPQDTIGYDFLSFAPLAKKTNNYFKNNYLSEVGSKLIKNPSDLSIQAGRGLMYIDGRLAQTIMLSDSEDGFAINGWSETNLSLGSDHLAWYSALCDEGRNLKGPASDFKYWVRELQLAVLRQNGKYFSVGDTALFDIHLINEGKLDAGKYQLVIKIKDGNGAYSTVNSITEVNVKGGDTYAQIFEKSFPVLMQEKWKAGYITIEAKLLKDNKEVATGTEQILLKNRNSFIEMKNTNCFVYQWNAARKAIEESGANSIEAMSEKEDINCILIGKLPDNDTFENLLKKVKQDGSIMILKIDSTWNEALVKHQILKTNINEWGGEQKPFWTGNGWGYIDYFLGKQAIPNGSVIGTNSWEVPCDPVGFAPFESNYEQQSFGAFFFSPDKLLTLIGSIKYGKGKIILAPSYPVDLENAFSDLLFYNMILLE